ASLGVRTSVASTAEAIVRTLRRLHADRGLAIEIRASPELAVRAERQDLEGMLGNLLDNACKWAARRVVLHASPDAGPPSVVGDSGSGMAPARRAAVLQRGVRADEAARGSGLGLAIVRDLAELYGGSLALDDSPLGGLRARLTLPAFTPVQ